MTQAIIHRKRRPASALTVAKHAHKEEMMRGYSGHSIILKK